MKFMSNEIEIELKEKISYLEKDNEALQKDLANDIIQNSELILKNQELEKENEQLKKENEQLKKEVKETEEMTLQIVDDFINQKFCIKNTESQENIE